MKKTLACLFLTISCSMIVLADNASEARRAYEARDYAKAARLFEAAAKEKNDAMSHYGLGLSYLRLGRKADAIKPLETAQQLDPSLKFAPSRQFFEQRLAEARAGRPSSGGTTPRFINDAHLDQVLTDFIAGKAVMDYTGTLTPADKAELENLVTEARGRGINLRAYLVQPGRSIKTREFATRAIKQYANLQNNDLVVVASQEGVYATGKRGASELDNAEITEAANKALPYFKQQAAGRTGFGLGMAEFSRALIAEAAADRSARNLGLGTLGLLGLGAVGAGAAFVIGRRKLKQKSYKNKLNEGINLLMNEINDKLGKEFDINARFVNWQKEYEEIKATNNWKDHTRIDRLNATLQDAVRQPERYFEYLPGIKEIKEAAAKLGAPPPPQRDTDDVFDYFDGRPLKKEEAVVVALKDKDGQEIRVLTSRAHAEQMGQGQVPKVLTREVDGRRVHWSNDPSFDPRRDYRPYDPYYNSPSWVDIWMMSQLFNPHTYYGPAIYPYYHQDYYYSQPYYQQPSYDAPRDWNGDGVIDFGESQRHYNEPVYRQEERSHYREESQPSYDDNSGGIAFGWGGKSSSSSWGSSDSSSDWGSSSGGSDWGGGSDFGGGDSGGGSDFGSNE
jgi:hypothetical protein